MEVTRVQLNAQSHHKLRTHIWIWSVCVTLLALIFIFAIWLHAVQITDGGMAPTLNSGDVILFDRLSKFAVSPRRGDIVAYQGPERFAGDFSVLVGRIVALPGETVAITGGAVYINGILLDEAVYVSAQSPDIAEYIVPKQIYFILPDSRADMLPDIDGLSVHVDRILGRAFVRVAPLNHVNVFVR